TLISAELRMADDSLVGNCIALSSKPSEFSLEYSCGDSSLSEFLRTGLAPTTIMPVDPNPVSRSEGGIRLRYGTRVDGNISIALYDELGRESAVIMNRRFHHAGSYEMKYDIRDLTSGTYILRYVGEGNRAISQKIVISN